MAGHFMRLLEKEWLEHIYYKYGYKSSVNIYNQIKYTYSNISHIKYKCSFYHNTTKYEHPYIAWLLIFWPVTD